MGPLVARDEREAGVDQAADRLSYIVLSFGLLLIVAYRSLVLGQASWELLALVVLAGLVGTVARARGRVISRRWVAVAAGTTAIAFVAAVIVAFTTSR